MVTSDLSDNTKIHRRVSLAQVAFHSLWKNLLDQRLTVKIWRQLYHVLVLSILLAVNEICSPTPYISQLMCSIDVKPDPLARHDAQSNDNVQRERLNCIPPIDKLSVSDSYSFLTALHS